MTEETLSIILACIMFASVYFLKFSMKYSVPTLVIYIAVGMFAGSEGVGGIEFSDPEVLKLFGGIALSFILFSGAFATSKEEIKSVKLEGILLAFIGVTINMIFVALPVYFFTPFDAVGALLFGAIVSSTDASAVISILSFGKLDIKKKVGGILKLESGSNDPMANVLILLLLGVIAEGSFSMTGSMIFLVKQVIIGGVSGFIMWRLALIVLKKFKINMQELHQIVIIAFVFTTFGVTNLLQGNGFLAVYILGICLGNSELSYKRNIKRFFSSTSMIVEGATFVALGIFAYPSELMGIWKIGIAAAVILIFIGRPLSVFATLFKSDISKREKVFLSWGGLKGAVPIIFATYPVVEGVPHSDLMFNLVFFVVLVSVTIQGVSLPFASKVLGLEEKNSDYIEKNDLESLEYFEDKLVKIRVGRRVDNKQVSDLKLPEDVLLVLIDRGGDKVVPRGNSILRFGDVLFILAKSIDTIRVYMEKDTAHGLVEIGEER